MMNWQPIIGHVLACLRPDEDRERSVSYWLIGQCVCTADLNDEMIRNTQINKTMIHGLERYGWRFNPLQSQHIFTDTLWFSSKISDSDCYQLKKFNGFHLKLWHTCCVFQWIIGAYVSDISLMDKGRVVGVQWYLWYKIRNHIPMNEATLFHLACRLAKSLGNLHFMSRMLYLP